MDMNPITLPKRALRRLLLLSMQTGKQGPNFTRYYMYKHLASILKDQNRQGKILSISNSNRLCNVMLDVENSEIIKANYPEYNLIDLAFEDNQFDFVVSDQVLEHVEGSPQRAIDETYRVLKPGGIAIHTTVFMYPKHGAPSDFWRFSPDSLKLLCHQFSRVIDVDGWGNPYAWFIPWVGLWGEGIPEAEWHPLHKIAMTNSERWQIVSWVVAQK